MMELISTLDTAKSDSPLVLFGPHGPSSLPDLTWCGGAQDSPVPGLVAHTPLLCLLSSDLLLLFDN
jgi:hypothetical protein